ncbi:serine/arginine repetitive matrix protein 4 isoform X2 [Sphaerodactylus townsendi]|uniref:serine/arginine repetitive matrix protein 4 isoform X2 n=1 Tax=Sphaerodactylus townsendi TaxID=933632 RepID=UPI00202665BD|nr:serine/arginine repetitive matrix protein 4 isoform X2 [Sphaerodactylus townsendi]
MASVQQGEKQLFEKFWKGTFKAVASPRPGSIIVTSITSRKPLPSCEAPSSLLLPDDKRPAELVPAQETNRTNGCVRLKDSKESARYRSHSPSCDEEFTPPPARGKKKKKKSTRKKRRRSPSCSPSPVKKKKKKKSSKKRKRNRLASKKKRHSSSSPKSKRKEERKHKKHTRSRPRKSQRHHHRHYRSGSESTNSLSESCGSRARSQEESRKVKWKRSGHSSKRTRKSNGATEVTEPPLLSHTGQNNSSLSATEVISKSGSSAVLFKKAEGQLGKLARQKLNGERYEYDSGNDTSSPPSTQTSSSRSKGSQEASCPVHDGLGQTFSSEKVSSDSSSDSGNSFTSGFSRTKGTTFEDPHPSPQAHANDQRRWPLQSIRHSEKKKHSPDSTPFPSSPLRSSVQNKSSTSRSSPESSHSHLLHHKSSRSCSSGTSYSSKSCKRSSGSRSSRTRRSPSYSRYSPGRDRERDHRYGSSGKESDRHHDRRRRKQSYSPMRKRRRDSPSHLEARRITSARKRPIPYYRPSPSSSSSPTSTSSYSSWCSNFSLSPSRSRSISSDRTGRSRSWSSSSCNGSRSHSSGARNSRRSCSRSSESAGSCNSMRR